MSGSENDSSYMSHSEDDNSENDFESIGPWGLVGTVMSTSMMLYKASISVTMIDYVHEVLEKDQHKVYWTYGKTKTLSKMMHFLIRE